MSEIIRVLAESLIIPFDCSTYAVELHKSYQQFIKSYGQKLNEKSIATAHLKKTIMEFNSAAEDFHIKLESVDKTKYLVI